jgi:hypothetical protein
MSYPVTYYCPRCGTLVEAQREGYLDDKSVTPYPLEGWNYVSAAEAFGEDELETPEERERDAEFSEGTDGVRFVCGEDDAEGVSWRTAPTGVESDGDTERHRDGDTDTDLGCGEAFYLSFVRFEDGREIDPRTPSERVELAEGETGPRGPSGPDGPSGIGDTDSGGGFYR